jgi:hypothetical protein
MRLPTSGLEAHSARAGTTGALDSRGLLISNSWTGPTASPRVLQMQKSGAPICHPAVHLLIRGSKPDPRRVRTGTPDRQSQGRRGRAHSSLSSSPLARGCPTCCIQEPTRAASWGDRIEGELPRPRSLGNGTEPHLANPRRASMDESPDHDPTLIEWGMGVHLNHPITARRGIRNSRPDRWELRRPHPPSRGGMTRERSKQVAELAPIASNRPRIGGSAHGYTSWDAPNADDSEYVRAAPPRPAGILLMPAEINTPHAGKSCVKTLAGAPTLLQGFGG